jgi:hypothetical protein
MVHDNLCHVAASPTVMSSVLKNGAWTDSCSCSYCVYLQQIKNVGSGLHPSLCVCISNKLSGIYSPYYLTSMTGKHPNIHLRFKFYFGESVISVLLRAQASSFSSRLKESSAVELILLTGSENHDEAMESSGKKDTSSKQREANTLEAMGCLILVIVIQEELLMDSCDPCMFCKRTDAPHDYLARRIFK